MRAEAGIRIKELNAHLDGIGLALQQMGGYDHQTIAGVMSTSTHGSGTGFGPLNDYVHSIDIGNANLVPAYSSEIAIPMDGRHIEAVERIFEVADQHRRLGDVYQSSPIALRFVRASPAYASMMHGADTMMIELIQLRGNEGGYEMLGAEEEALYEIGGRPHWGQVNTLTGSHGLVASMYPRYEDWQAVHRQMNASGVFDSPFSKRVGITADRFTP